MDAGPRRSWLRPATAATVRAALQFTTAGAAAETLTGPALLANGVIQAMNLSKWSWLAAVVVTVGLLGGGGAVTYQALARGEVPQAGVFVPLTVRASVGA